MSTPGFQRLDDTFQLELTHECAAADTCNFGRQHDHWVFARLVGQSDKGVFAMLHEFARQHGYAASGTCHQACIMPGSCESPWRVFDLLTSLLRARAH